MKAIVVTDQAAETAGMTLVERPEPQAAINDVVVQVHASGFVRLSWRGPRPGLIASDRDRTPSNPWARAGRSGHRPRLWHEGAVGGTAGVRLAELHRDGTLAEYVAVEARNLAPAAGRRRLHGGREPADLGPHRVAGTVRARPPSGGAGRRSRGRRTPARRSRAPSDGRRASGADDIRASSRCELRHHRTDLRRPRRARGRSAPPEGGRARTVPATR